MINIQITYLISNSHAVRLERLTVQTFPVWRVSNLVTLPLVLKSETVESEYTETKRERGKSEAVGWLRKVDPRVCCLSV